MSSVARARIANENSACLEDLDTIANQLKQSIYYRSDAMFRHIGEAKIELALLSVQAHYDKTKIQIIAMERNTPLSSRASIIFLELQQMLKTGKVVY